MSRAQEDYSKVIASCYCCAAEKIEYVGAPPINSARRMLEKYTAVKQTPRWIADLGPRPEVFQTVTRQRELNWQEHLAVLRNALYMSSLKLAKKRHVHKLPLSVFHNPQRQGFEVPIV